jgi:hypothetical protein
MKHIIFLLVFFSASTFCVAQKCWSLDQGWIPCSTSDTLKERATGNYYVIVRDEKVIKAFDQTHRLLWQTNPWKDKQLSKMYGKQWDCYLSLDSIFIQTIDFPKTEYMGGNNSIVVYFNHQIVGSLNRRTGYFIVLGEN